MRRLMLVAFAAVVVVSAVSAAASGSAGSAQARWVITDLGVRGSPVGARARGRFDLLVINNRGQVAGRDEKGRGFLWDDGRMRARWTLGGGYNQPVDINERGEVVGFDWLAKKGADGWHVTHAYMWRNGRLIDLGTLASGDGNASSEANAINDRGQIVGTADTKAKRADGYPIQHAFLWESGRMRDLGASGRRPSSAAAAVNGQGQIVGTTSADVGDYNGSVVHGFRWQDGRMLDLGPFTPIDINRRGQVIGENGRSWGVLWNGQGWASLKVGANPRTHPTAIDGSGQIAGTYEAAPRWTPRGFLWNHGKGRDLGSLGGETTRVYDMNERGQVVGMSRTATGRAHAFVWEKGTLLDLGTLPGGRESDAIALNDRGQIVGYSETTSGQWHAVLWTLKQG